MRVDTLYPSREPPFYVISLSMDHKPGTLKPRDNAKHGAAHYSDLYKVPYKTASKWRSKGYPMDDPEALLDIIMGQKSTAKADLRGLRNVVDEIQERAMRKAAPQTKEQPPLEDEFMPTEEGLMGELQRLEHEAKKAYRDYTRARKPLDKKDLFELWKAIIAEQRQVAKVAPEAAEAAGQLVKVADVEAKWLRSCAEMSTTLEAMARRISMHPKLRSVGAVAVEQIIMDEVTKIKKMLFAGKTKED